MPWPARSFTGFRLLTEYFAFPDKFMLIDLDGLDARTLVAAGKTMDIFIYLDRSVQELERALDADSFALGCAPAVNLFAQRCDPVMLDGHTTEYRVEPDRRRPGTMEVWMVDRVRENRSDSTQRPWAPFHRLSAGLEGPSEEAPGGFFTVVRRDSADLPGTDVLLGLHDPAFDPEQPGASVLSVDATCTNRDLPTELPFGGGHPRMTLADGMAAIGAVSCLKAPTAPLRRRLRERGFWQLVSHLSLGHLSVAGGEDGATPLREVLRLYDLRGTPDTMAAIEGLVSVSVCARRRPGARRASRRVLPRAGRDAGVRRAELGTSGGLYLLASVLDRFLALHATVNAFVRTSAVLRGRPGAVARWPARAGARPLL